MKNNKRHQETIESIEKAFVSLLRDNELIYRSTFADSLKDYSKDVYATKALPELLNITLLDQNDIFYKKLHDDQRFIDLAKRIECDLSV